MNDQVTSGVITFDDGSSQAITTLNNDGSATIFNLSSPVNTTSFLFTVTGVSSTTGSVGLAEISAYYSLPQTPVAVATSTNTTTTLPVAGDLDGETWADDLALADGVTATASSLMPGQDPGNLVNGNPSGYKEVRLPFLLLFPSTLTDFLFLQDGSGDAYQEWATASQGVGAWAKLVFPQTIIVNEISLYVRSFLSSPFSLDSSLTRLFSPSRTAPTSTTKSRALRLPSRTDPGLRSVLSTTTEALPTSRSLVSSPTRSSSPSPPSPRLPPPSVLPRLLSMVPSQRSFSSFLPAFFSSPRG